MNRVGKSIVTLGVMAWSLHASAGGVGAAGAINGYLDGAREQQDREYLQQQRAFQLEMQKRELQRQSESEHSTQQTDLALLKTSGINGTIFQCVYETLTGFRFSINSRDSCPATVRIDPVTMRVSR